MTGKVFALALAFSLIVPVSLSAQEAAKTEEERREREEREKKAFALLDEVIKEAQSLRLDENRIRVQAVAGDMLWSRDERRARALIKQATDSLLDLLAQSGSPLIIRNPQSMWLAQAREQLKQEVIQILARRDARLARDFLHNTRLAAQGQHTRREEQERDVGQELQLAMQIAARDPAQALQIAEESIQKGLRQELLSIFQHLEQSDRKAADKLLTLMLKKLRSTDLSGDRNAASLALALLRWAIHSSAAIDGSASVTQATNTQSRVLDKTVMRELMEQITSVALSNASGSKNDGDFSSYMLMELGSMIKEVEKHLPSRAREISRKIAEREKKIPPEEKAYTEYQLQAANGNSDTVLELASKAPAGLDNTLYQQAAMKAFNEGDEAKARQIINENITDPIQREQLLNNLDQQAMWRALNQGKIEETRQMAARLPAEQRTAALIQLANVLASKGEKQLALQVMDEARGTVGYQPVSYQEFSSLLSIARAYVGLEPARSFEIIEPIIERFNTLIAAAAVLDGFDHRRYFKDGELLPQNSSTLVNTIMQCVRDMTFLATIDFDRARAAADRFQQSELRLFALLHVAHGGISDRVVPVQFSGRRYGGVIYR